MKDNTATAGSANGTVDAVVIGAGHNGLVAALYLARAGWQTLVLERNVQIGGAVRSGEVTLPGFVHDLYATNLNLFLASPVYKELKEDLGRHGLAFAHSDRPYCNLFPDGKSLRIYQDVGRTVELLHAHNPADAVSWEQLYDRYRLFKETLMPLYHQALPSLAAGRTLLRAVDSIGLRRLLQQARIILNSTREMGSAWFDSPEARTLLATWGMHLDFGPDVSGGAMFPFVELFGDMEQGMHIVKGGASRLVEALAALLREAGGEVRTSAGVAEVLHDTRQATGVRLQSGETIRARRAVIANVAPTILFEHLISEAPLPGSFFQDVHDYRYGPGTMMIHLALDGPAPWQAEEREELQRFAYVHIAPYVEDLSRTYEQALNGYLPDEPLLIVGQTTAVDPSRAPEGKHILWVQVRALPSEIKGDAAGQIAASGWDEAKEPYARRVLDKLERYAPGLQALILGREVYSPLDLERANPNLVGGDSLAGSHHLRQQFLFRPFPNWSRYKMPLGNLYMVGAATWPGAGTHGASGYLAAQQLLGPARLQRQLVRGSAIAGGAALATAATAYWLARVLDDD